MKFHTIKSVKPLKDMVIEVLFFTGESKKYDIKPLTKKFKSFEKLNDINLFNKVKVEIGGYAIIWDENIDLSSEEIWKNGVINKK